MMHLVDEPGTRRLFVSTMRGPIFSVSYDGKTVTEYVDINAPAWKIGVQSQGSERGFQSFAFHPQFSQRGSARLRQVLHLHRHAEHDAEGRLHASRRRRTRTTRCCSSGPRRIRRRRPTTAARRASCSASRSRLRITTAARSRSTISRARTVRTSACSTSARPMAAAAAIRMNVVAEPRRRPSARSCASIRSAPTAQRQVRHSRVQSVRQRQQAGDARRDLRLRRAQSAALLLGLRRTAGCIVADIGQNIVEEISPVTPARTSAGTCGKAASTTSIARSTWPNPRSDAAMTWPIAEFDHTDPLLTRAGDHRRLRVSRQRRSSSCRT